MLERLVSGQLQAGETARPPRLVAAMRHGVLNGGKRLRPFLLIETAALFGADGEGPMRAACALECVHCYSLIHDDLPAMDDDDLRRGQPTVHRAFDEATAILAGDALLTLAFDILADAATDRDPAVRCELVLSLARAAGLGGMAGGQMLDLAAEGRRMDEAEIVTMQAMKTGALLRHACEAGAVLGGADAGERAAFARFGVAIGRAFQLADDILDVTATPTALGKRTAKDRDRGKATLVALHGLDRSRRIARDLLAEALAILEPFGERAFWLGEAARFVVGRDH
ncbi:MAG: (2E,6E)-farnesyl diphosphate synthase [Alphaproteobacteria bacterium]|nr:MAG: (2E,6E)-farnesyl diphosphate synthase [Alphaproteobacteria bacterium]